MATKKEAKATPKPKKPAAAKAAAAKKPVKQAKKVVEGEKKRRKVRIWVPKFLRVIGSYFKGAWQELRQVRWPNRRATWGLTLAVILFTLFWVGVIVGLDAVYGYIFNELIL